VVPCTGRGLRHARAEQVLGPPPIACAAQGRDSCGEAASFNCTVLQPEGTGRSHDDSAFLGLRLRSDRQELRY
jgi:hypothetical protein